MSVQVSPNLPANVVEIGNEITQAKIDEINAGTLALQTWVSASYLTSATASSTYAPKASPTFTGTVTIPAGASISGYLTTSTASSTYQTIAGMSSYLTTASASSTYQTQAGMSSYLTTASASSTYAPKASPTFTGTVTIPAGASISGYLTTSSAASTYQTISGMSTYATQTYVTSQGYLTDAPSNGSEYVRKNGAWSVATGGGGGGGISDAPSDGYSYVRQMNSWISVGASSYDTVTTEEWVNSQGFQTSTDVSTYVTGLGYLTSASAASTYQPIGSYLTDAPSDGSQYVRLNGAWSVYNSGGLISGGASYTITPADAGKVIVMDNLSGNDYIYFSGTFVAGTIFYIVNKGSTYTCEIQAGMSYNLNDVNSGTFSIPTQSTKTLICTGASDFWIS